MSTEHAIYLSLDRLELYLFVGLLVLNATACRACFVLQSIDEQLKQGALRPEPKPLEIREAPRLQLYLPDQLDRFMVDGDFE